MTSLTSFISLLFFSKLVLITFSFFSSTFLSLGFSFISILISFSSTFSLFILFWYFWESDFDTKTISLDFLLAWLKKAGLGDDLNMDLLGSGLITIFSLIKVLSSFRFTNLLLFWFIGVCSLLSLIFVLIFEFNPVFFEVEIFVVLFRFSCSENPGINSDDDLFMFLFKLFILLFSWKLFKSFLMCKILFTLILKWLKFLQK